MATKQAGTKGGLIVAAFAVLSTIGATAIMQREGYTESATIPVPGDVPTIGYGATTYQTGEHVKLGDRITADQARALFDHHASAGVECVKEALNNAAITQAFFDLSVDHVYQFGCQRYKTSSMARYAVAGDLRSACNAFTLWRYVKGHDCANPANWGKGANCRGVWLRAQEKQMKCLDSLK